MNTCLCGCGGETRSRFQPGHDAKLKGRLVKTYREGGASAEAAKATLLDMGWGKYIGIDQGPADHPVAKAAKAERARANRPTSAERTEREQAIAAERLAKLNLLKEAATYLRATGRYGSNANGRRLPLRYDLAAPILAAWKANTLRDITLEDLEAMR